MRFVPPRVGAHSRRTAPEGRLPEPPVGLVRRGRAPDCGHCRTTAFRARSRRGGLLLGVLIHHWACPTPSEHLTTRRPNSTQFGQSRDSIRPSAAPSGSAFEMARASDRVRRGLSGATAPAPRRRHRPTPARWLAAAVRPLLRRTGRLSIFGETGKSLPSPGTTDRNPFRQHHLGPERTAPITALSATSPTTNPSEQMASQVINGDVGRVLIPICDPG